MYSNYILYNTVSGTTYNGSTNNLTRRLRQHNGELKGGAKSTKRFQGFWKYLVIVNSEQFTRQKALSFEWHVRYPTGRKPRPKEFSGPLGRLEGLGLVLKNDKFADCLFDIWVDEGFIEKWK
jgi:predicted GIY-YIG superfamily endonuclease